MKRRYPVNPYYFIFFSLFMLLSPTFTLQALSLSETSVQDNLCSKIFINRALKKLIGIADPWRTLAESPVQTSGGRPVKKLGKETGKDTEKSENQKVPGKVLEKKLSFIGFGCLNFGMVSYYPYTPAEGDYTQYQSSFGVNPPEPYEDFSWAFGIGMDYRLFDSISLFFDGGFYTWRLLLARKDGYAYGQWVAEQTGYSSAVIGPFSMDTYYYMDTTAIRIGARYILSAGNFQPWIGIAAGAYAWQATIGNRELGLKYGNPDSGISPGYSILTGIDLVFNDFCLRIFGDYGSAIGYPRITGLIKDNPDAVFENTGGEFVTGPYKIGIAICIKQ